MHQFTVVPVDEQHPSDYDALEGVAWVDYRERRHRSQDPNDTVSSDGK